MIKKLIRTFNTLNKTNSSILITFLAGITLGYGYKEITVAHWLSTPVKIEDVNVCFTPPQNCEALIVQQLVQAKSSIHVQAYDLTSQVIANELIQAHNRGAKVSIILDRSNLGDPHSKMRQLKDVGINIMIDTVSGIAHNKVIILDQAKVVTGSYNFSRAAAKRNAENLLLIDDPQVTKLYMSNWITRQQKSVYAKTNY